MAFRTRRRRKPLVQWFPTAYLGSGANIEDGTQPNGVQGLIGLSGLTADFGEIIYDAFPVTYDFAAEPTDLSFSSTGSDQPTLHELIGGSEYRLRRIIGKFHAWCASDELDSPAVLGALCRVGAGFIVCKCYDDGSPLTDFTEVNPLAANSMDDPWIWRRTWMLSPFGTYAFDNTNDNRSNLVQTSFPRTTAGYGSVLDGPHIDQKTARRVHRQERLFFVMAGQQYRLDSLNAYADTQIGYYLDYRLLGSIIATSAGNRRNTSR